MASQMPKKVRRAAAKQMTIITAPVKKTNGKVSTEEKAAVAAMKTVINPETPKTEEKALVAKVEPEKPVIPAAEPN